MENKHGDTQLYIDKAEDDANKLIKKMYESKIYQ